MPTTDRSKPIKQLLDKLRGEVEPVALFDPATAIIDPATTGCSCHHDLYLREFVRSFLVWESTTAKAEAALRKIDAACVDINDFRVSMPVEMAQIIGVSYPRVEERVLRLRAALNDLFKREDRLRLTQIKDMPKKAAAGYLAGLSQTPQFVADRVGLLTLGIHAVPTDQRLCSRLIDCGTIPSGFTSDEAADLLARHIRSGEAREAYAYLQAWSESPSSPTAKPSKPAAKPTAKSTKPSRSARAARPKTAGSTRRRSRSA